MLIFRAWATCDETPKTQWEKIGNVFPPWKTLIIKFPPPRDGKSVKCPGYAWGGGGGGGMLKLRFDRYIIRYIRFGQLVMMYSSQLSNYQLLFLYLTLFI